MSDKTTKDADGHPTRAHKHSHTDPDHHVGPCGVACKRGTVLHNHRRSGEKLNSAATRRKFEREYGKKKGDYVWGAIIGQQTANRRAARAQRRR